MLADLRFVLRGFRRSPGFFGLVVVILALGIGANTAIFSLFDQVLLRLLPVEDPGRLVIFHMENVEPGWTSADNQETVFSYPRYKDLRDRSTVFSGLIARSGAPVSLLFEGQSERADAEMVSGDFFDVLGVRPWLGRVLHASDDQSEGGHPVAVLSYRFFERRFGGRPEILEKKISLNGHPFDIAGVAPPGFYGVLSGRTPDLFVPLAMRREIRPAYFRRPDTPERQVRYLNILARLKPGVSREQAEAAMETVHRPIMAEELERLGARSQRLRNAMLRSKLEIRPAIQGIHAFRNEAETPLVALMALVGVVLLIACVNVANLLLARTVTRAKEIAIRLSLGSSRWRLARQLLLESISLGLAGGLLGLLVASWTVKLLLWLMPPDATGGTISAALDWRILAFNFALAALTGVLFGLLPALEAARADLSQALKDQPGAAGAARGRVRIRKAAVAAQVALSVLLLAGAGLFVRTFHNLKQFDPGFRLDRLLSFAVDVDLNGYARERGIAFYQELQRRLARLPGVAGAASAELPVLANSNRGSSLSVEGYAAREDEETSCARNLVSPDYFRTMGIPVLLGREFTGRDIAGSPRVAVVNEAFVERYLKGRNPLGRRLAFSGGSRVEFDIEIVGVVKNGKQASLREKLKWFVFTPYAQENELPRMTFYLRSARDETALGAAVRAVVREMDPGLPVFEMKTVERQRDEAIFVERLVAGLASAFGALATLLAATGLYGVMSYTVARRTREIGVRMALGAVRADIFRLVFGDVLFCLAVGLGVGIPAALALARYVASQLFGVGASDPLTLASAAGLLSLVAFAAGAIPARRAARLDPMNALRYE